MRAVIQRVSNASVSINNHVKSEIKTGLLLLIGIEESDNNEDIVWLSNKITQLRIFDVHGRIVSVCTLQTGTNEWKIDLERLQSGIYFINSLSNNKSDTQKFTIIR